MERHGERRRQRARSDTSRAICTRKSRSDFFLRRPTIVFLFLLFLLPYFIVILIGPAAGTGTFVRTGLFFC